METLTRDARGRIMADDWRYGRHCPYCPNLKGWQSKMCRSCYLTVRRDEAYWAKRMCECGGPKSRNKVRCLYCENERRRGQPAEGRPQPADHPWKRRRVRA